MASVALDDQIAREGSTMAPRTLVLLVAPAIVGIVSVVVIPTDALAKKAVVRAVPAVAPGRVVVPDSNIPADRVPRCVDSVIRYPSPPCY